MKKDLVKNRKKDLGIFYTPQEVVSFIFKILNIWKNREDEEQHRWQTRKPNPHYPSVIDPACGEGIFLKTAVTSGFTGYHPTDKTPYIFGVDLDGEVVNKWEEISILNDLFNGKREKMLNHFHQQDGLLELPKKVFRYKTGGLREFDAAVGNPPYGGIGFSSLKGKSNPDLLNILDYLRKFNIISYRKRKKKKNKKQSTLWEDSALEASISVGGNHLPTNKEVESIPIEILFIDRFIQLVKPGGWISIIIPDGILTNSNSHYIREFIYHRTKVEAIISLPRDTFINVGTNAKTSILFLKKYKKNGEIKRSYKVFLASMERLENANFENIIEFYKRFYNAGEENMNKLNQIQITKDQTGKEIAMIRIDKSLNELMEEKPTSRWNPNYWHPKYDKLISDMSHNKLLPISNLKKALTSGYRGSLKFTNSGVPALKVRNVLDTGIDLVNIDFVPKNSPANTSLKVAKQGDLIINRSGTGSIGRMSIYTSEDIQAVITGDVYLLRLTGINPFYVNIFLKTCYGKTQIHRFESGVSGQTKIDLDEILNILIPILDVKVQRKIEFLHKKFTDKHDLSMKEKKNNNVEEFRKYSKIAKEMLNALIKQTEEVIEGKRKDVN